MTATAARPRCPRCRRPLATCLCAWVRPTANRVPVWLLQHPLERDQAKGSLPLLRLSLARCRCDLVAAHDPGVQAHLAHLAGLAGLAGPAGLADPAALPAPRPGACATAQPPVLLLYPAERGTIPVTPPLPLPDPAATRLVVLDGTWRKTHRLLHDHPASVALPRWPLPAPPAGRYGAIRRAHRPGQLSTLEAVCHALAQLEGDAARYAPLLAAFDAWVAEEAARAAGHHRRPVG